LERHHFATRSFEFNTELGEDSPREAIAFANEAEKQVLRADIAVVEVPSFVVRKVNDAFRTWREGHFLRRSGVTARKLFLNFLPDATQADAESLQDACGYGIGLTHQSQEEVLGRYVSFAEFLRFFLCVEDDFPCSFSEPLPHFVFSLRYRWSF
jgi:hypothetical protein